MPHRYTPPQHTSGVFTPGSGEIRAGEDGILELGDDAIEADHAALIRAGCTLEATSRKTPAKKAASGKQSRKPQAAGNNSDAAPQPPQKAADAE